MTKQDTTIEELEMFFATAKIPSTVQLDSGTKITNASTFLESHFSVLKHSGTRGIYEVFYNRLIHLKELLSANPK
jgi:hypothetical protein